MNRRSALSLVELLVVMTVSVFILSTVSILLHRTMRAQSETRYFFDAERSAMRLARQFRDDMHGAETVSISPDATDDALILQLEFSEGTQAEYRQQAGGVVRILRTPEKSLAREDFRLGEGAVASVERAQGPDRVTLLVSRTPVQPDSPGLAASLRSAPIDLRVEAVLGLDRQLSGIGGEP